MAFKTMSKEDLREQGFIFRDSGEYGSILRRLDSYFDDSTGEIRLIRGELMEPPGEPDHLYVFTKIAGF